QRLDAHRHREAAGAGAERQAQGAGRQGLQARGGARGAARDRGPRGVRQDRGGPVSDKIVPLTKEELQDNLDRSPFIAFLGLKVTEADPVKERVTMTCAMKPEFERGAGT